MKLIYFFVSARLILIVFVCVPANSINGYQMGQETK